jgi:sugar lactone lactonase YvrE
MIAPARSQPSELGFLSAWPATVPPQSTGNGRFDIDGEGKVYVTATVPGSTPTGSVVVHDLDGKVERVFPFKEPDPSDPNRLTDEYTSLVATDGSLWVIGGQNLALHHFASDGTLIGRYARRTGDLPVLVGPNDLAEASDGTLLVLDTKARRVVRFSQNGEVLSRWGSLGTGPGQFGAYAPVSYPVDGPHGMATDGKGTVYVADTFNNRIEKFSEDGRYILSFGQKGTRPGQLSQPEAVAVGHDGRVFVVDGNGSLEVYSSSGKLLWFMGGRDLPAEQTVGQLVAPSDVAVAPDGRVAVLDGSCSGRPLRCGQVKLFGPGGVVPAGAAPPQVSAAHIKLELGAPLHTECPRFVVGISQCSDLTLATVRWSMSCVGHDARPGWAIALRRRGSAAGPAGSYRPPGFSGPTFEPAPPRARYGEWFLADGQDLGRSDPRKSNVLAYASSATHSSGARTVAIQNGVRVFPVGLFVCRRRAGFDPRSKSPPSWQEGTVEVRGAPQRAG